jgi:hypothetical protein
MTPKTDDATVERIEQQKRARQAEWEASAKRSTPAA